MFVPQEKLKKVTVLGAGLLVGTALAVIIPEGVSALLPAPGAHAPGATEGAEHEHSNLHAVIGISLVLGEYHLLNDITLLNAKEISIL